MREIDDYADFIRMNEAIQSDNSKLASEMLDRIENKLSGYKSQTKRLATSLLKRSPTGESKELVKQIVQISTQLNSQTEKIRQKIKGGKKEELLSLTGDIQNLYMQIVRSHHQASRNLQSLSLVPQNAAPNRGIKQGRIEEWESAKTTLRNAIRSQLPEFRERAKLRELSLLEKGAATDTRISKKQFAHIFGDVFITESGLEGMNNFEAVTFLKDYLGLHHGDAQQFQSLRALIDRSMPLITVLQKAIDAAIEGQNIPEDLMEECRRAFSGLKDGENLLIPSGWRGEPGHTVYIKVTKTDENTYSFRIYNKGAGISPFHPSLELDGKEKYHSFIDIVNIPKSSVNISSFILPIVQMRSQAKTPGGEPAHYNKNDYYDGWLSSFKGQKVVYTNDLKNYTTPHHSGICTWAGLEALVLDSLKPEESERFFFEFKLKSAIDFFKQNKEELETDEELRLLLQNGMQQFVRECLELLQKGNISIDELKVVYATLDDIMGHTEAAEQKALAFQHTEAPQADLSSIPATPLISNRPLDLPPPAPLPLDNEAVTISKFSPPPFSPKQLRDPQQAPQLLDKALVFAERLYNEKDFNHLGNWITTILEKLPIPQSAGAGFWEQIAPEKRESCMVSLSNLTELLLCARTNLPLSRHQRLNDIVNVSSTLTILHRLALQIKIPPGLENWGFRIPGVREILGLSDVTVRNTKTYGDYNLYDPTSSSRIQEIVSYFRNHFRDTQSLESFSFDNSPDIKSYETVKSRGVSNDFEDYNELFYVYNYLREKKQFEHRELREIEKAVIAMRDLEGEILPPAFCAIKKQFYLTNYFIKGDFLSKQLKPGRHPIFMSLKWGNPGSSESFRISINGENNYGDSKKLAACEKDANSQPYEDINNCFTHSYQDLKNKDLQKILWHTNDWYWDETYIQSADLTAMGFEQFSSNEVKELMCLRAVADSNAGELHRELQIPRTISYFQQHMQKLKDPEYQAFFKILLLENDYIADYLKYAPEFAGILLDFVRQGYEKFLEDGDYKAAAFFGGLLYSCQLRIGAALPQIPTETYRQKIGEALAKDPQPRELCIN